MFDSFYTDGLEVYDILNFYFILFFGIPLYFIQKIILQNSNILIELLRGASIIAKAPLYYACKVCLSKQAYTHTAVSRI